MKKIVIFNVGGALSSYGEIEGRKFIIDLGSSIEFSPIDDFLLPLTKVKHFENRDGYFWIDQLFLSHLDRDHISDYSKFSDSFYAQIMTCPNNNRGLRTEFQVHEELLGGEYDIRESILYHMRKNRRVEDHFNPLFSVIPSTSIYYLTPEYCYNESELKASYANNISIAIFIRVGDKTVLFPGDLMKSGMSHLINTNGEFKYNLNRDGVDYLIAPHHGLQTSFSQVLFDNIAGNKTRLNIISEKVRSTESQENRSNVDTRYYEDKYSTGDNSLGQRGVKTSQGHIIIDFSLHETIIKQTSSIDEIIEEFK